MCIGINVGAENLNNPQNKKNSQDLHAHIQVTIEGPTIGKVFAWGLQISEVL